MRRGGRQIKGGQGPSTEKPCPGSERARRNAAEATEIGSRKGGVRPSRVKTSDF